MKLRAAAGRWIRPAAQKFPADAVHGDAVIGFRDGGEKSDDAEMLLWSRVWSAMALSLPPLQQKRMGSFEFKKSPTGR